MRIEVRIIPKSEMPYDTWDNYYITNDGDFVFEIADTGNIIFNRIMLIHAMVEQLLTDVNGISAKAITDFDMNSQKSEEPGEEVDAPYRNQHLIAKAVEMLICAHLNIPWKLYNGGIMK
jgi:hypothetical protein